MNLGWNRECRKVVYKWQSGPGWDPAVKVGVALGIFFTSRILLGPNMFYQCLLSLGFLAGPISSWENHPCATICSICLVVLSRQLVGCFKYSS